MLSGRAERTCLNRILYLMHWPFLNNCEDVQAVGEASEALLRRSVSEGPVGPVLEIVGS